MKKVAMRSARATTGTAGDHRIQAPAAATGLATAPVLPPLHADLCWCRLKGRRSQVIKSLTVSGHDPGDWP